MKATILKELPPSGTYVERPYHTSGRLEGNISVLFESGQAEWLGIFGRGDFGCTSVKFFMDNRSCLVIAEGEGYVIELNSGNLLYKPASATLKEFFSLEDIDIMFAWSDGMLLILSSRQQICESIWLDIDRIKVTHYDTERIQFKLWDIGDEFDCCVDLKTNQLILERAPKRSEMTKRLS